MSINLYRGVRLQNDGHSVTDALAKKRKPFFGSDTTPNLDIDVPVGDGIGGIIVGILLWIVVAIVASIALWLFAGILEVAFAAFIAVLYWIFFRALRLVFRNSNRSRGNLFESMKWAFVYTVLYNFWIYGVFMLTHYWKSW